MLPFDMVRHLAIWDRGARIKFRKNIRALPVKSMKPPSIPWVHVDGKTHGLIEIGREGIVMDPLTVCDELPYMVIVILHEGVLMCVLVKIDDVAHA